MLPRIWPRQRSISAVPATAGACVRWIGGRKIEHTVRAVRHHSIRGTLSILTLVLLLAACSDPSAPSGTGNGAMDPPDMYQIRGWNRKVVELRIAPDTAVVSAGQSVKFTASGIFSDGRSRVINVSWAATGGTIDSTGLFTADSTPGVYQVIGVEPSAGLTDTAAVIDTLTPGIPTTPPSVDQPPPPVGDSTPIVSSVSVTPATAKLVVGGSLQLKAAAVDSNGGVVTGLPVSWSSSNSAVASVSSNGTVQTLSAGTTSIIALIQGVNGTASITVNEPAPSVSSVSLTPSSATLAVGESVQLSATAKDGNGSTIPGLTASWTTSAPAVVSVSSSGVVRGLASGTSVVTGTIQGIQGTTTITVRAPIGTGAGECSSYPHDRLVSVSTAAQLGAAIADAQPGDLIQLAAGTYTGRWKATASGTSSRRIVLCGPRAAILNGGDLSAGITLNLSGASYWILHGFTATNSLKGVVVWGGRGNVLDSLEVTQIGQEGVAVGRFSRSNIIRNNSVHDTGKLVPQWGEGIYVGTSESNWCTFTNCQPDTSDSNQVVRNTVFRTTADGIQVMAGTTGVLVRGNTIDGAGMVSDPSNPVWVLAMGNNMLVDSNTATNALTHGMKVRRNQSAWGNNNVFRANMMNVGSSGYGIILETTPAQGTVVTCDNDARNASSGLSNVSCTR